VRRADLGDVDLKRRVLADEYAGRAGMVEVDVREEQVPEVAQLEPALGETGLEGVDRRRGPAVVQCEPVVGVDEVRADDALVAEVPEVDRAHCAFFYQPRLTRRPRAARYKCVTNVACRDASRGPS
jgi:hypothetical protein